VRPACPQLLPRPRAVRRDPLRREGLIMPVRTPETYADAPSSPPPGKMTYEEFLDWAGEDDWVEWVDGEVIRLSPATNRHQRLVRFLSTITSMFIARRLGGEILFAPFQMKTGPSLPGREPDLLYVAPEHMNRLRDVYLDGPADLVVEI